LVGFGIDFGKFVGIGLLPDFIAGLIYFLEEVPFLVYVLDDFSFYFLPSLVLESAPFVDFYNGLTDTFKPAFDFYNFL